MEKSYCIYMHKNKINNKIYIGQSCNPQQRWENNGIHYKGCPAFFNAILKYGWDNFEHIILYNNLSLEQANQLEIDLIKQYDSTNPNYGYNIALGGKNSARPFVSEYLKEKWQNPEYRQQQIKRMSGENSHFYGSNKKGANNPMYGKHHSEETKKIISRKAKERFLQNPDKFKGSDNPKSKAVICLTTGEIFECQREAANWVGVGSSTMSRWLRKETKTTGKHPLTGEPLKWDYYNK